MAYAAPPSIKTLKQPVLRSQDKLDTIEVQSAPPLAAPSGAVFGCVTGVVTGNTYEDYIISHESGGNTCAVNASSGACNLFQEWPCGKSGCNTSQVDCELAWGYQYATSRYGGWEQAYNFWVANHYW